MGGIARITENVNREVADRAGDTRAIEVQGGQIGGPDVVSRVHFHAGEDRKKILSAKLIKPNGLQQCPSDQVARMTVVKRIDLLSPGGQSRELVLDRLFPVGDVV